MVRVVYIEHDGVEHSIDVPVGESLMLGAVRNRVPGILAACAGDGGCATCQIYVEAKWKGRIGPPGSRETHTLRFAFEPNESSRLACQIKASDALEGLVVRMPRRQF